MHEPRNVSVYRDVYEVYMSVTMSGCDAVNGPHFSESMNGRVDTVPEVPIIRRYMASNEVPVSRPRRSYAIAEDVFVKMTHY